MKYKIQNDVTPIYLLILNTVLWNSNCHFKIVNTVMRVLSTFSHCLGSDWAVAGNGCGRALCSGPRGPLPRSLPHHTPRQQILGPGQAINVVVINTCFIFIAITSEN